MSDRVTEEIKSILKSEGSVSLRNGLPAELLPKDLITEDDPHKFDIQHYKWRVKRRIGAVGLLWNRSSDALLCIHGLKAKERDRVFQELYD